MTEVPKSAGESALRFSTAGEAIAYVGKHNLSRVEADPIFDANEIDRDDAWAMVEKARAAEKVAYFEEGRRARERLAASAIAALEASRQPVAKPKPQAEREDFFPLQHNPGLWKMETRRSCRPRPNLRRRSQNQNRRRLYRQ
jgi:hypothetical protein